MLSNPPFGVEWKKIQKEVEAEAKALGFSGRFGPGLPRVSDGSLLFLLHLISKMRPAQDGGCRIGIVLNGSPLFTGGAGSGESEIRRYLPEGRSRPLLATGTRSWLKHNHPEIQRPIAMTGVPGARPAP
jgi:type I restriction enzyme M protein